MIRVYRESNSFDEWWKRYDRPDRRKMFKFRSTVTVVHFRHQINGYPVVENVYHPITPGALYQLRMPLDLSQA